MRLNASRIRLIVVLGTVATCAVVSALKSTWAHTMPGVPRRVAEWVPFEQAHRQPRKPWHILGYEIPFTGGERDALPEKFEFDYPQVVAGYLRFNGKPSDTYLNGRNGPYQTVVDNEHGARFMRVPFAIGNETRFALHAGAEEFPISAPKSVRVGTREQMVDYNGKLVRVSLVGMADEDAVFLIECPSGLYPGKDWEFATGLGEGVHSPMEDGKLILNGDFQRDGTAILKAWPVIKDGFIGPKETPVSPVYGPVLAVRL